MFQGLSARSRDQEQERSAARAVSSSENACKNFPHSKLCKIFKQRREEKADIWIKSCWELSGFETEYLAANKVNRSVAYLFGWISRANNSFVQEADWLPREEQGWKNIYLLRMLSQVLFSFAYYSQAAFFLHLCARLTYIWEAAICSFLIFWWNIRAGGVTIALRLLHSCLDFLSSTSHQKLILLHLQDFVQADFIQRNS